MTEYDHEIDRLIINELKENKQGLTCTRLHDSLNKGHVRKIRRTVRYAKVWEHLTKLDEAGIVEVIEPNVRRRNNETLYCLTASAELELDLFGSVKPVRSGRESSTSMKQELEEYDRKACLLTLLRAASGTELPKLINEPIPGAVASYNQGTRIEYLVGAKAAGVVHQDVVAHNDMMTLFRHVDFTKSRNYVEILRKEFRLRDALEVITRPGKHGRIVTGIKIADSHEGLKSFLEFVECMLSEVEFRISQTLKIRLIKALYRKGSLIELPLLSLRSFSILEREAFGWYIDMMGRKAFNLLYNDCKKALAEKMSDIESNKVLKGGTRIKTRARRKAIRKFIQEDVTKRMGWIERSDKNIIAYYRGLIECDKIVDFPGNEGGYVYNKKYLDYHDYVRNVMSKGYHDLMNTLLRMVYPEFLRKRHGDDQELERFTESLRNPDAPGPYTWHLC